MARDKVRAKRPKLETKEELIDWIKKNPKTEIPFSEEVWKIAVEKVEGKERKFKEVTTTDFDGNESVRKIPNGAVNPVSKYLQLIALPNFKTIALNEASTKKPEDDDCQEFIPDFDEESEEDSFVNELIAIYFSTASGEDLQFVVDRLSDYYTNYEFNEGSDKFLVVSAVSDELSLRELYGKRTKGSDNEAKIEKIKKGYLSTLESLKVLKKQGTKMDEGKNKFTAFLDELEKAGDLSLYKSEEYPEDQIDELIVATRRSIVRAFGDG